MFTYPRVWFCNYMIVFQWGFYIFVVAVSFFVFACSSTVLVYIWFLFHFHTCVILCSFVQNKYEKRCVETVYKLNHVYSKNKNCWKWKCHNHVDIARNTQVFDYTHVPYLYIQRQTIHKAAKKLVFFCSLFRFCSFCSTYIL